MEFDKRLKKFYLKLANEFRPKRIKTLFVGESFPTSGVYFYWPQNRCSPLAQFIFKESLHRVPNDNSHYLSSLKQLKRKGRFLIDVYENPLRAGKKENKELIEKLIRGRVFTRIKRIAPRTVYFILPDRRGKYEKAITELNRKLKQELGIEGKREKSPWIHR